MKGFTLIELMITLVIVGILAVIAIPPYQSYLKRAYYVEVVQATEPYRVAVGECAQLLGTLTGCNAGTNHIPAAMAVATGAVDKLDVVGGVITVSPVAAHGILTTDTYILTPTLNTGGVITWKSSGAAVEKGYAS